LLNEFFPFRFDFIIHLWKYFNTFLCVYFVMQNTKILIKLCRLKTRFILATLYFLLFWLILPEIKTFWRKHFWSYWSLKIFVWYHTVPIKIKLAKNTLKFFILNIYTPKIQIILKLIRRYFSSFALIDISKCFSQCSPLILYLL
jgi:hypothetical protein